MLKPTNSAAEQIVALQSINTDIDTQIASLQATQQRHLDTIAAFDEIATWEEVAELVAVEEEPVVEEITAELVEEEPVAVEMPPVPEPMPAGDVIVIGDPSMVVDGEFAPAPVVEAITDTPVQATPRGAKKKK